MWRLLALALLTLITLPAARAETYKWVDANGTVNYSNTPPPGLAKSQATVADRISTYQTDPALKIAAAQRGPSWYEERAEREWLQRQQLMAAGRTPAGAYPYDYADAYYPAYAVRPVYVVRPVRVGHHRGPLRR